MTFDPYHIRRQFPIFNTNNDTRDLHYLDNAATTQVPECVVEAVVRHETRHRSNVKRGIHRLAEAATAAYENARYRVARYLNADAPDEVVFTAGTTSGINMLAQSLRSSLMPRDEILLTQAEHHSNLIPWQLLSQEKGVRLRFLPVDRYGIVDLNALSTLLTNKTRLVSVCHGSNVTGAILDLPRLSRICREYGTLVIADGAQTAAQGPLDLPGLGADFFVFSGHKVYGPTGIGVLWGRRERLMAMPPSLGGGEMIRDAWLEHSTYADPPHRFEAGTPPVAQAVGLAAALDWLNTSDLSGYKRHCATMAQKIVQGLNTLSGSRDRFRLLGPPPGDERLPLVSFALSPIHPHDICQLLNDRRNVALRGGHHCAQPLHHLLGLPEGSTRASLACYNTSEDVDALLNGLEDCLNIMG